MELDSNRNLQVCLAREFANKTWKVEASSDFGCDWHAIHGRFAGAQDLDGFVFGDIPPTIVSVTENELRVRCANDWITMSEADVISVLDRVRRALLTQHPDWHWSREAFASELQRILRFEHMCP